MQILEKAEKINYLNLLLLKKVGTEEPLQLEQKEEGVKSDRVVADLKNRIRKYEVELIQYRKQNANLRNDVEVLKKGSSE